ncbi:MAG: helix-hairpin-helix domain-containing protein [Bacteroidaceae bacterium]|nr:helix-hairpin-helix domain-containing protein [Bacteroidaceae bacterium]
MKRQPSLTQSQRRALLVLEWVLLLGIIGLSVWSWQRPKTPTEVKETKNAQSRYAVKQYTYAVDEEPVETFPFDPNTADSTTLLRLGLAPWQVRSIYRYRAKHGRYHTAEDFKRLPGMTVEMWQRLGPQVRIAKEFQYVEPSKYKPSQTSADGSAQKEEQKEQRIAAIVSRDSFPRQEKLKVGQTIDINTADTTQLKMIPGIASKRAAKIVAYRNKLGGFVSAEQAMEAVEMPDSVLKYMTLSSLPVQKINVNKLSVQRLMNHPYLNFYQAKAINEYRRNHGELHSIEELSRLESFKPTDIDRLRPYVEF